MLYMSSFPPIFSIQLVADYGMFLPPGFHDDPRAAGEVCDAHCDIQQAGKATNKWCTSWCKKNCQRFQAQKQDLFFKKMSLLKEYHLLVFDSLCYYHGIQALAARKKTSAAKKLCTAGVRQRLSNEFSELFLQKVAKWTLRLGAFAVFFGFLFSWLLLCHLRDMIEFPQSK